MGLTVSHYQDEHPARTEKDDESVDHTGSLGGGDTRGMCNALISPVKTIACLDARENQMTCAYVSHVRGTDRAGHWAKRHGYWRPGLGRVGGGSGGKEDMSVIKVRCRALDTRPQLRKDRSPPAGVLVAFVMVRCAKVGLGCGRQGGAGRGWQGLELISGLGVYFEDAEICSLRTHAEPLH